jgi:L-alanine-DL-glutamate epimerase-like enolase superfamily enzyme
MPAIAAVRPVLLSAPYADPDNLEVQVALPTGWRTTGLVEVTLDDGTTGLGEAYLPVFAPHVFTATVDLLAPYLVDRDAEDIAARYRDLVLVSGYWSLQGAARHVIAAMETALVDAVAKRAGVPAHALLGDTAHDDIGLYASGGDSTSPGAMRAELDAVQALGIETFKIRARAHEANKAVWTLEEGRGRGVGIAVDMAQNLADPGQSVTETLAFLDELRAGTAVPLRFLEEALGPARADGYPRLRAAAGVDIAGGEIVTTARELRDRVSAGWYDIVQPDVTVVGGLHQTLDVFAAAREYGVRAVVHCWGSAVCQAANYHAAFAGGGTLAEWPLPAYPLRTALLVEPFRVDDGRLARPGAPGLGVVLDEETERRYAFRPDAVYRCLAPMPPPVPGAWREGTRR